MRTMPRRITIALCSITMLLGITAFAVDTGIWKRLLTISPFDRVIAQNAQGQLAEGRRTFRYDTFGDEAFWGDLLGLHRAIAGADRGGVGPGLSPRTALELGLKVDSGSLPRTLLKAVARGQVNLDDPGVTLALLKLNAVVGVTGFFEGDRLKSVGIQCALCHSTVDNSVTLGIGHRLDGWANRDLDVGRIVALAPNLTPFTQLLGVDEVTVRAVLASWGPGKFDAELVLDGKAFRPDGGSAATLIPPAFGLAGVNLHTWTGWGSVTHWNAFVSNLEMHGKGTFYDPRLDDATQFPIAAREGFGNVRNTPDLITSKLAALHVYQLNIPAPAPPSGSFDAAAARRGAILFADRARCATCHVPPLFTEPGWNMHTPAEIGIDAFQSDRSPDHRYRTAPLKGLWTHMKGGFYHDGRFATLAAVIDHYDQHLTLGLSDDDKSDLEEYLKSLGDAPISSHARGGDRHSLEAELPIRLASGNPSRQGIEIELDLVQPMEIVFEVFDVTGRRVTPMDHRMLPAGSHRLSWNGRRADGSAASPGQYFARVRSGEQTWSHRITLTAK